MIKGLHIEIKYKILSTCSIKEYFKSSEEITHFDMYVETCM